MKSIILSTLFPAFLFGQETQVATPQWRPVYHFTAQKNWINDPNGLIYMNGVYHLFHQYNPFENKWGHMSWGHSTSRDLIHWTPLPVAMSEKTGVDTVSIFSGCAVWDKNNTSGFCKGGGCMVAVYTGDISARKEAQYVSYSLDSGATFSDYNKNPIIDLQKKDFRDPNVFWYEKNKSWIMVVALPAEKKIRIYRSANLKDWTMLSEFGGRGLRTGIWECPFLVELPVEGVPGKTKWALVISTSALKGKPVLEYFTGSFDGHSFQCEDPKDKVLLVDQGDCFYAAIPWNNLPGNKKTFIGWMMPGILETSPWKGQMSIPRDLSLRQTAAGLQLIQRPAAIISGKLDSLSGGQVTRWPAFSLAGKSIKLDRMHHFAANAYWIDAEFTPASAERFGFKVACKTDSNNRLISETVIGYDVQKKEFFIDRSKSGSGKINADRVLETFPVGLQQGKIRFQLLVDRSSVEIFANDGQYVLSAYFYPDEDATGLQAFSDKGTVHVDKLKIWDLSGIRQYSTN